MLPRVGLRGPALPSLNGRLYGTPSPGWISVVERLGGPGWQVRHPRRVVENAPLKTHLSASG